MSQRTEVAPHGTLTPQTPWRSRLRGATHAPGLELAAAVAGAAILFAQPNRLLWLGVALLALPWVLRVLARQRLAPTPLDVPLGLFVAGAAIGLAVTSDPATATIRWWGIIAAVGLAYAALPLLHSERACRVALWATLAVGAFGAVLVLGLTQGQVARGPLGELIAPWLEWFKVFPALNAPVMETNTRYIVNYNGLADLGLLVVVAGVLLAGLERAPWRRVALLALAGGCALLVLATGGRGGVLGLVAAASVLAVDNWRTARLDVSSVGRGWLRLATWPLAGLAGLLGGGFALAASGVLDKGLELDSIGGRILFWRELLAILGDYPFTGIGLGMQAPLNAIVFYAATPSPGTMVYAHNMFLQTYMEQGPLGTVGLGLVVMVAVLCGVLVLRQPLGKAERAAGRLGLAVVVGVTVHGLTDQVPTTNYGTLMLLAAATLVVGLYQVHARSPVPWLGYRTLALVGLAASIGLALAIAQPRQPADLLANLGALQADRATVAGPAEPDQRRLAAEGAERLLVQALAWSPEHVPALRQLARVKLLTNDPGTAAQLLAEATAGDQPLSAFDAVQLGRLYYQLGFLEEGHRWTRIGYEAGQGLHRAAAYEHYRVVLDQDWRVRTLVEQAEDLRDQREFEEALPLFEQALSLAPDNRYLIDQVDEVGRAAARQTEAE